MCCNRLVGSLLNFQLALDWELLPEIAGGDPWPSKRLGRMEQNYMATHAQS